MEHASTETLSRPAARTVRAAPQTSPIASDTALLAACRELDKQRRRLIATGRKPSAKFYDLLDTVRTTPARSDYAEQIRAEILAPAVPVLPLTASNAAIDAAVERIRQSITTEAELGRAHTRAEIALQQDQSPRLERAEAKAERAFLAARRASDAARVALLETTPGTMAEAQIKLHAHTMAVALGSMQPIWWREMSFDDARDVVWSAQHDVQDMTIGLEAYAVDMERLTAPPTLQPPTDPSSWGAAYSVCDKAEAVFYVVCDGSDQAAIDAARDAFVAARDALFLIPAPDATALAQKIALHPDAPALRSATDLAWHLEKGDGPDKAWASLVADAQAVAAKSQASPIIAALAAEFERRWGIEEQAYNNPDDPDPDATAEHLMDQTYAMVRAIEAQPAVTVGDFAVRARLVAWGHSGVDQMRATLGAAGSRYDQLTLDLLNDLLKGAPAAGGKCAAADLIPAFRAAFATREADFASEDRVAREVCAVVASSVTGVLFQLSIADRYLSLSNEFDHGPAQEEMHKLGRAALLNASKALSGITGVRLSESGWGLNEYAQNAGLPL